MARPTDHSPYLSNGRMRIVVDVSDISPRRGKSRGIYSYARLLVEAMLPALPKGEQLVVLCNGDSKADFERLVDSQLQVVVVHESFPRVWKRVAWCLFAGAWAARRQGADVYFSPKGYAPLLLHALNGARCSVVTIHDLIPLWYARHFPNAVGRLERWFVNGWLVHSALHADRVIAVSQATANVLRDELGRTAGVAVVRNAVPALPQPTDPGGRRHIFAMSSALPHKNLAGILAAYRCYRRRVDEPLPLIVCGVRGDLGEGVVGAVDLGRLELANLYATARVFLFLPLVEGFGFPVAEALSVGTPVVCSDIAALHEATGGAARFVAPQDAQACATALLASLTEPSPSVAAPVAGSEAIGNWAHCGRQTVAVLQSAAQASGVATNRDDSHRLKT